MTGDSARGADGEVATAAALAALAALPSGWVVLHDRHWPGRRHANIDHVVVGPPGVFVVDTRSWTGVVTTEHGVLRQNGFSRDRVVRAARQSALDVAGVVPSLDPGLVRAVLCLVEPARRNVRLGDVWALSTASLVTGLTALPAVLSAAQVVALADDLRRGLAAALPRAPEGGGRAVSPRRGGSGVRGLTLLAAGAAALALLTTQTQMVDAVGNGISDLLVSNVSDSGKKPAHDGGHKKQEQASKREK